MELSMNKQTLKSINEQPLKSSDDEEKKTKTKTKTKTKKTKSTEQEIVKEEIIVEEKENVVIEEQPQVEQKNEITFDEACDVNSDISKVDSVTLSYSKDEYMQKLDILLECINFLNDKNLKDLEITKEFMTKFCSTHKKATKAFAQLNINILEYMLKENVSSMKKDSKNSKPKKIVDNLFHP